LNNKNILKNINIHFESKFNISFFACLKFKPRYKEGYSDYEIVQLDFITIEYPRYYINHDLINRDSTNDERIKVTTRKNDNFYDKVIFNSYINSFNEEKAYSFNSINNIYYDKNSLVYVYSLHEKSLLYPIYTYKKYFSEEDNFILVTLEIKSVQDKYNTILLVFNFNMTKIKERDNLKKLDLICEELIKLKN
jgi:hypothetical protein